MRSVSFGVALVIAPLLLAGLCAGQGVQREIADADIDRAIDQAKRFLFAEQRRDGGWVMFHRTVPNGGYTAIAAFALLEAGESPNDPKVAKALEALVAVPTPNVYVISLRVMALSRIVAAHAQSPYREQLVKDVAWLTADAARQGGAWGYGGPQSSGDNSCSQFALLALWEADRAGIEIDPRLIRLVERTWLQRQRRDGGWTYAAQAPRDVKSTVSMTTAGIASLYICQDLLSNTCRPYTHKRKTDAAWKFLAANLPPDYHDNGYLAFCVQRVGMASGRKRIAGLDWFSVGARKLAEPDPRGRSYRGEWGKYVRASFELIFLTRGRLPLTFNKLEHGRESEWNFHARDVPHFTEFMRRKFEQRMRWRIVKITDTVDAMLDAPILLVTGTRAPDFSDEQWGKLREYTLRGGTLLMVPTHDSGAFLKTAKDRLSELYADQRRLGAVGSAQPESAGGAGEHYTLEPLPEAHPLYSVHRKIDKGHVRAPMWGVSDGTRLLAVVCKRDICCSWQRRDVVNRSRKDDFTLGVNLFRYATGANSLGRQLRAVFAARGRGARDRAKVAWVAHDGTWYTQPYALKSLSEKLMAENRVALDVTVGAALEFDELKGHDLVWMTGSSQLSVTDRQRDALKEYIDSGGTVFINAVGGSPRFNQSADAMLRKLFADEEVVRGYVVANSPLMTGRCGDFRGPKLTRLQRTSAWRKVAPSASPPHRVYDRSGRIVVIHATHGVHDTLDGHTAHGALSYMPDSARDIAANVVLYALTQRPEN